MLCKVYNGKYIFLLFIIVAYTTTTIIRNLGEFSVGALFYTWYIFNTNVDSYGIVKNELQNIDMSLESIRNN